jgi:hypothetical protein
MRAFRTRIIRTLVGLTVTVGAIIMAAAVPVLSPTGIVNLFFLVLGDRGVDHGSARLESRLRAVRILDKRTRWRVIEIALARREKHVMKTMKAVVFKGKDRIAVEEVPKPRPRAGEAVIRVTTTTICGTDVHIVRGEYPVKPGLVWATSQSASSRSSDRDSKSSTASGSASSLAPSPRAASAFTA